MCFFTCGEAIALMFASRSFKSEWSKDRSITSVYAMAVEIAGKP